ncbi:F0F1 ATP synthase subunit gamma [Pseudomonadota bacterium]
MAGAKEIRTKIKSIQSTQKITKAMEMVAASKMRKCQDRMNAARPYSDKIYNVVRHLAHASTEYNHPFLVEREPKRIGYLVVSSDRGLCGGLNTNLFRTAINDMDKWQKDGAEISLSIIGSKGLAFFKRFGLKLLSEISHIGDTPSLVDLIGSIKVMLDAYEDGELDRVYFVVNQFENTMTQKPTVFQLLPLIPSEDETLEKQHWDYLYEPDAKEALTMILTRYIEALVYRGVVENIACEQAARMVAMKSATDNAGNLIDELQLIYNKARQAAITQEISEIVGGAAAV